MKKILIFLFFSSIGLFNHNYAQPPGWKNFNPGAYEHSMNVFAEITHDCIEDVKSTDNHIGVFDENNALRGTSQLISIGAKSLAVLNVYSNQVIGEQLYFRIYNAQTRQILESDTTFEFKAFDFLGTLQNPIQLDAIRFEEEHLEIQNETLTGFRQQAKTIITKENVSIITDQSVQFLASESIQLKPGFEVKKGANFLARIVEDCEEDSFATERMNSSYTTQISPTKDTKNLKVFPNPIEQVGTLHFTLDESSNVEMAVYSYTGHLVLDKQEYLEQGEQEIQINSQNLINGMYLLFLKTDREVMTQKILIQRN